MTAGETDWQKIISGAQGESFITPGHQQCSYIPFVLAASQYKDSLSTYEDFHYEEKMVMRLSCLVHPAVRDKRRVSEIDLSQPRHETAFWWRHNGPVTSQLTDPIKWRNYPFELMFKCAYINTHNKESMTQRYRISTNVQLCLIFLYISIWFES